MGTSIGQLQVINEGEHAGQYTVRVMLDEERGVDVIVYFDDEATGLRFANAWADAVTTTTPELSCVGDGILDYGPVLVVEASDSEDREIARGTDAEADTTASSS